MLEIVMAGLKYILVPMFILGMIGSTIVVAVTFTNDVIDFVADDDAGASHEPQR